MKSVAPTEIICSASVTRFKHVFFSVSIFFDNALHDWNMFTRARYNQIRTSPAISTIFGFKPPSTSMSRFGYFAHIVFTFSITLSIND